MKVRLIRYVCLRMVVFCLRLPITGRPNADYECFRRKEVLRLSVSQEL